MSTNPLLPIEEEDNSAKDETLESELWTLDEVNWRETTQDTTTIDYVPVQVRPMMARPRERVAKVATEETDPNRCALGSSSSPSTGCSSTPLPRTANGPTVLAFPRQSGPVLRRSRQGTYSKSSDNPNKRAPPSRLRNPVPTPQTNGQLPPRDDPTHQSCRGGRRRTDPGFENVTSMKFLEGSEEEPVLGDTPPDPSVFAGPDLHTFKDASRDAAESGNPCVCSETLGVLAPLCGEVFKPKMVSAASPGAVLVPGRAASLAPPGCARSVVPAGSGRRALRTAKRAQVSAPLECTDVVKGPDKFEQCFTPHRRVISSDSDLLALNASIQSARRVCSSSVPGGACVSVSGGACRGSSCFSCCGRASLGESGALCRVCAEGAHQSVVSSGHNSWEHGHETARGTKALNQCSGYTDRLSFVDTVSGGAALEQYLRGAPKGTKVEAWEGRIFTCSRPTSWDVSVAEGCKVTVSAVYLPKKRPGLGWSRLLYTASSGIWIFRGALRGSQVMPALASCFDWAVRGTYRTAWAVQPCCRCSYSYGNGPAVGPQVSENWSFFEVCGRLSHP